MKQAKGFTLIELALTIVITGILAGIFVNFFALGTDTFNAVEKNQGTNQNGRIVLLRMGKEIKQAASLTITSATDINFSYDVDDDGADEVVRYFLSGDELHKTIDGANDTLMLEDVSSLSFTGNGSRIVIAFTIAAGGQSTTLETSFLRRKSLS
jgi:prepilin-type N-terminal cleavage/methylation domain-containing protein